MRSNKTAIILFLLVLAPTLFFYSEQKKQEPKFCISCHLNASTLLHTKKYKDFNNKEPVNLAGLHRLKQKDMVCVTCHTGHTPLLKGEVTAIEILNTLQYFLMPIEEPKEMDEELMPDENCTVCHKPFKLKPMSFHGITPHMPNIKFACVKCHSPHIEGKKDYFYLSEKRLKAVCLNCHPNLSLAFMRILKF